MNTTDNFVANTNDIRTAERIRREYLPAEQNRIERLRKLDAKVKTPGMVVAFTLGIIAALVLGGGMSLVMVEGNMVLGLVLGIPGLIVLCASYPLYLAITGSRKRKYADEIMRLSDDVMRS